MLAQAVKVRARQRAKVEADRMMAGHGSNGSDRVIRGGSWNNDARNVRSAIRNWNHPGDRNDNLGVRLARAQRGPESLP